MVAWALQRPCLFLGLSLQMVLKDMVAEATTPMFVRPEAGP